MARWDKPWSEVRPRTIDRYIYLGADWICPKNDVHRTPSDLFFQGHRVYIRSLEALYCISTIPEPAGAMLLLAGTLVCCRRGLSRGVVRDAARSVVAHCGMYPAPALRGGSRPHGPREAPTRSHRPDQLLTNNEQGSP
jgi:hypothetical protein